MKRARFWLLPLLIVVLGVSAGAAQRFRAGRSAGSFRPKAAPETEFAIARWYSSGWQGDGWSHDYPASEEHILQIISEVSLIDVNHLSYQIVDLASPDIFKYPFSYVSHPGEVFPSDVEIENLKQYIERGGFLMLDDFGGQGQGPEEMANFKDVLRRAFPGREMYVLKNDHPLLGLSYVIDNFSMEHPMSHAKSTFYGFDDDKGHLAMVICHDNDVGDYWEFIDQPYYRLKPSTEALKFGVNMALYSMTH